jgi:hypothetical protein
MARKLRIAAFCIVGMTACLLLMVGGTYYAAQQVLPFYEQALRLEPEALQRGSRELESRATALYSQAQQVGEWHALFTAEQINGWLALQLDEFRDSELSSRIRDPRVAISRDAVTLGFRATSSGVETVVSMDAGVHVTDEHAVAVRLMSVRAGTLPLPVMQVADKIAAICQHLSLPVRWTRQEGQPVAIVEVCSDPTTNKWQFFIDAIELGEGELYVAGHTEMTAENTPLAARNHRPPVCTEIALGDFELRLTPRDNRSALKVTRRPRRIKKADPSEE